MLTFTSRRLNRAAAVQSRTSQAQASSTPAPMHQPSTAAITGLLHAATARNARCNRLAGLHQTGALGGASGDQREHRRAHRDRGPARR